MNTFMILTANQLQNVHAPLPLKAHIIFCVIATVVYGLQFMRKKLNYYFYIILAVDLTILTQFYTQNYVIWALAVAEIILLVMAFVSQHNHKKKLKEEALKDKQKEIMQEGEKDGEAMRSAVENNTPDDAEKEEEN